MDLVTAQITFAVLMSLIVLAWALSLRVSSKLREERPSPQQDDPFAPLSFEPSTPEETVGHQQTVRGSTEDVSRALVDQFTRTAVPGNFATIYEVTQASSERVVVAKTGPLMCNQPTGMYFSEAQFELRQLGEDVVEVSYELGFDRLRQRLRSICLIISVAVALPVMIVLSLVLWFLVVNNPNPTVRWQVFQTLQMVHFLWPPFLLVYIYRNGKVHANTYVSNMLRALRPVDWTAHDSSR